MTKKQNELVKKIKLQLLKEVGNSDFECAHSNADDALCELLNGLGFTEIVDIYKKVGKWYA